MYYLPHQNLLRKLNCSVFWKWLVFSSIIFSGVQKSAGNLTNEETCINKFLFDFTSLKGLFAIWTCTHCHKIYTGSRRLYILASCN